MNVLEMKESVGRVVSTRRVSAWIVCVVFVSGIGLGGSAVAQPSTSEPARTGEAAAPAAVPAPAETPQPLSALTGDSLGRTVTLVGTITNKIAPSSPTGRAPYRWYVTDGQGVALLILFPDTFAGLTNPDEMFPVGGLVKAKGEVTDYRGQLQVVPDNAGDVKKPEDGSPVGVWGLGEKPGAPAPGASAVLATPTPPKEMPGDSLLPGQVNRNQLDTTVKVAGQVTSFRASWSERAPNILTLSGGEGSVDVVYWREVEQGLGDRMAAVTRLGNYVRAEGTLSEFRNNLQLRVEDAGKLEVLAGVSAPSAMKETAMEGTAVEPAVASPTPPGPMVPGLKVSKPSEITKADLGRVVVVSGQVQSIRSSTSERAPTRVYLTDDSTSLPVVYWADLAEKFSGDFAPKVGQPWKVYGTVSEYRDELQIRAIAPVAP